MAGGVGAAAPVGIVGVHMGIARISYQSPAATDETPYLAVFSRLGVLYILSSDDSRDLESDKLT